MKPEALSNGISAGDASRTLGVAPAVAKEYLLAAEAKGTISTTIFMCWFDDFLTCFPCRIAL